LQEFLLKHSQVKFILDNERKRSFAQADVNTIIALLAPPDDRRETGLDQTARFVMFKVPFEEVLDAETFKALEAATERESTDRWRITVVSQRQLFEEGLAREEADDQPAPPGKKPRGTLIKTARYEGNKWGGKYLRAPDIFFTILEKGKGKLVRLGDIAEVRFGIKTGANEFFYLDEEKIRQWGIEPEFLKPVIKSPRECRSIVIKPEDLKFKIFMCHKDERELKGTAALEYIQWGESQGFHLRPSCRGRQRWWDVGLRRPPQIVSPSSTNDLYRSFTNEAKVLIDKRLYEIVVKQQVVRPLATVLNSTLTTFFLELGSRTGLGEGLLDLTVYEVAACLVADPVLVRRCPLPDRVVLPLEEELHQPDRRALDDVVFDVLGLTAGEREAVYEAVIELVRARLEKARSV
jgi:hypothetical protein